MAYRMMGWVAGAGLLIASVVAPAMAQDAYVPLQRGMGADAPVRYHHGRHHRAVDGAYHGDYVTLGYGETIISGKTGQHRSIISGVMVPDSEPPDFVLTGRATGTGPGANGFPGSNQ